MQLKAEIDGIVDDLNALEAPIENLFARVEELKAARHPEANDYYKE